MRPWPPVSVGWRLARRVDVAGWQRRLAVAQTPGVVGELGARRPVPLRRRVQGLLAAVLLDNPTLIDQEHLKRPGTGLAQRRHPLVLRAGGDHQLLGGRALGAEDAAGPLAAPTVDLPPEENLATSSMVPSAPSRSTSL